MVILEVSNKFPDFLLRFAIPGIYSAKTANDVNVVNPETGRKQISWMFLGIMGYSRYLIVRLVWTHDVSTTLTTLEEMFKELGGVPKRIIPDYVPWNIIWTIYYLV